MIASIFNLRAPHTPNFRLFSNEPAGAMRDHLSFAVNERFPVAHAEM
jgi:hypothetical protein